MEEPRKHRLKRNGLPPLVFVGQKLAYASNEWVGRTSWHTAAVYRTSGGRWVVEVIHRTIWQDETDDHAAYVAEDEQSLRQIILEAVPPDLREPLFEATGIEDWLE